MNIKAASNRGLCLCERVIVFDELPHAFWNNISLPESREAFAVMAKFLDDHLGNHKM